MSFDVELKKHREKVLAEICKEEKEDQRLLNFLNDSILHYELQNKSAESAELNADIENINLRLADLKTIRNEREQKLLELKNICKHLEWIWRNK